MSERYGEPWRLWADGVPLDESGQALILALRDMTAVFRDPEVARRVVAAVNSVAGISTEALESGALGKALDLLSDWERIADDDPGYWREVTAALRALGRLP